MTGAIALVAACAFAGFAVLRLAPGAPVAPGRGQLWAALVAGAFGVATWRVLGDTRWLVGGVLMFGAGLPIYLARGRRALVALSVTCGLFGLVLFAVAAAHPMARAAPSAQRP